MATTITPTIVNINVSVIRAPQPSQLQRSGAFISLGESTLTPGTFQYVGSYSELEDLLNPYESNDELIAMGTSFFAQGQSVGAYVLELGTGADASDLQAWITDHPENFYAYLLPDAWDNTAELTALLNNNSSNTARSYFFWNSTVANVANYTQKAAFANVPAPDALEGEFVSSGAFYNWLVNNPSAASPLRPMQFREIFGLTRWTDFGNEADLNTILTAHANYVGSGAEGGLNENILRNGTLSNGDQSSWWYGVDWFQIQSKQALAAAVINGSNSITNPLLYNQSGINRLLSVLQGVLKSAIAFGCLQSGTINAISFADYVAANPSDYAAGIYNGFSATVVGQNGFLTLTFNIDATQIA